jgi:hypothetical protein
MGLDRTGRRLTAGAIVATVVAVSGGVVGAACQTVLDSTESFLSLYPTGGNVARFDGARGDKVMQALAFDGDGDEVVFLYSGDGPVTGARGRYMYLILDPADCIIDSGWIEGAAFDRLGASE